MTELDLSNVTNLQSTTSSQSTINANSAAIVTAVELSLAKDGSDSQMSGNLDMNSNRILNLPAPSTADEPVRMADLTTSTFTVYTVTSLPAGVTGQRVFVTNATATTFASIVSGGGTNGVPVYSDGTNWRIG